MAFTPKTWQNEPSTATPLSAAALVDLETRLAAYTDQKTATGAAGGVLGGTYPDPSFSTAQTVALTDTVPINVRSYGATGNGSTDDRAAIQAALDANPNRVVFLQGGVYRVNGTLYLRRGSHLVGDQMNGYFPSARSTVVGAGAEFPAASPLIAAWDTSLTGASLTPVVGSIQGLYLDGNSLAQTGIYWRGRSPDWQVSDVEVGSFSYGFRLEGLNSTTPSQGV